MATKRTREEVALDNYERHLTRYEKLVGAWLTGRSRQRRLLGMLQDLHDQLDWHGSQPLLRGVPLDQPSVRPLNDDLEDYAQRLDAEREAKNASGN